MVPRYNGAQLTGNLKNLFILMIAMVIAGCVGEETSPVSPSQDPNVNPAFEGIGVNIKSPSPGATVLDHVVLGGRCSHKDYPIKITSPKFGKTIYSVCQADFTWAAAFNAESLTQGGFTVEAQIYDSNFSSSSTKVSVALTKGERVCTSSNAKEIFANFKTGGDGAGAPYVICNSEQFSNIRFYPNKKFVLGQNVDFANKTISPISVPFKGELDGNGFRLSNIVVKDIAGNGISVGLFKYAHDAVIRNVAIKNILVEGYQRVGVLAGDWRGSGLIENVKVQGKVSGVGFIGGLVGLGNTSSSLSFNGINAELEVSGNDYVGGIISYIVTSDGSFALSDSYILSQVSGIDYVGGVVGRSLEPNFTVQNTERIGNIEALGKWTGGIAGELPGATLMGVKNVGNITSAVSAEDVFVGGLIGESRNLLNVSDSESAAAIVAGGHYIGAVVGKTHSLNLSNTITRGSINVLDTKYDSVTRFVGGIAGGIGLNSVIDNARTHVDIVAKAQYVGGLVGVMNGLGSQIKNSYFKGPISAHTSHVGAIAGIFAGSSIQNCFSQAELTINNPTPNSYVGGIAGQATNPAGSYTRVYSKGNITIANGIADYVGGLFGYLDGALLKEAYYVGDILGARSKIGGLAGYTKSDISRSYSIANLNSNFRYVGTIAGLAQEAAISDVFGSGNLTGKGEVGGLVGWFNSATSSLTRAYFVGNISKLADSVFDDTTFGQVVGLAGAGPIGDVFYASTNKILDPVGATLAANTLGESLTVSQLRNTVYYSNFDFGENAWAEPASAFKLPFVTNDFLFATFDWLRDANQGFQLPEVFSYDPLTQVYPSIFIQDGDILSDLDQDHLAIIDSSDPVSNVSQGALSVTVEAPATNSEVVSGMKLVYGECGIPGNRILIGGAFSIASICQENNRWAAVLDVTGLPVGTINFSVVMKSLDGAQSSNTVNKSVIKSDDLCEKEEAIKGTFANTYLGADGGASAYKICHAGHFANIAFYPGANFEIVNDIDFGGNTITPIQSVFTGSLNGNGHVIKNYLVDKASSIGAGLFRLVKDASITNLKVQGASVKGYERVGLIAGSWVGSGTLSNVDAKGSVEGILYTGGVIGLANTGVDLTIENVQTQINVKGNGYTGGVLGHISTLDGTFVARNLTLKNTVEGLNYVGGLIGSSLESNVVFENISQTGNVTGMKENVGGIAGHLRGGSHTNLSVSGNVTSNNHAKDANVGGIVGLVELTTFNLNTASFNGALTSGGDSAGGIVGKLVQGTMTNLQSQGSISVLDQKYNSVRSYVGGLVGHVVETSSLTNSFSTMGINAKAQYVGGLAGRFSGEDSILTGSFFNGSVTASTAFVGGIAGFFFGETFQDNNSKGNITVVNPTPNAYIGGIVGYANSWTSDYQRIYATGDISISGGLADYVGGLIGYFRGGSLSECYATGNISGARSAAGGLVGLHRGSTRYCFASGDVEVSFRHAGGLVGYLLNGSIQDSFSLGAVSAKAESGGLLGYSNTAESSIANVYAYGVVQRALDSEEALSDFGPIVGKEVVANTVSGPSYYASENVQSGHNTVGSPVSLSSASDSGAYASFDFASAKSWRMPAAGFVLPGASSEYTYPIHEWLGSGEVVETYGISGSIAGLNYGQVDLTLNSSETITISQGQASFAFTTRLNSGEAYDVVAVSRAGFENIECSLASGSGYVGTSDVANISLVCPSLQSIGISPLNPSVGVGESVQLSATGSLSNGVQIDLSSAATWSSSNTGVASVSSGLVSALASGSSGINATLVGLNSSTLVTVYSPVAQATGITWAHASPRNQLTLQATWTPSVSTNVSEQLARLYQGGGCSGTVISEASLGASTSTHSFTGQHNKTYSYLVTTLSSDGISKDSTCSGDMLVQLDPPDAATGLASAATWINGSLPVNSPALSWTNPGGVSISNIKVGLGSSFGADDIAAFVPIGVNNGHVFQGLNGINECSPYFPSVIVVDQNGIESAIATDTAGFRWDNTAPSDISSVAVNGEATQTSTPEFSWAAPGDNCALRFYEIAIGSAAGLTDISGGYKAIGNVTSYTAISGLNGFNLNLEPGTDYYANVRSVDYAGNRSNHTASASWQVPDLQSSLPDLIAHLDSSQRSSILDGLGNDADSASFEFSVDQWGDVSTQGSTHHFRAPASEAKPYFTNGNIFFNGADHVLSATSHAELDLSIQTEKSVSVAFRTENNIDSPQVIYEQGDEQRGMNIAIQNGNVYCAFWNTKNDGDGAQSYVSVSSTVLRNKSYRVTWNLDYTNYTGRNGADGQVSCYVNGSLVGSVATTSRLHPHGGGIGVGAKVSGTHFVDGASSGDGASFRGEILELMISNTILDASSIENIHTYFAGKWGQDDLSRPNNLASANNAAANKSVTASWQPIDPSLFNTASYEISIGTTPGGTEVLYWMDIGNILSYQAIDGVDGAGVSLSAGVDYYFSVRAIDTIGNTSQTAVSAPWKIFDFASAVNNVVVNLAASDLGSVFDKNGRDANQGAFGGEVQEWWDTSGLGHVFYSPVNNRPAFDLMNMLTVFNGKTNVLLVDDSADINTSILDQKSVTLVFETGTGVSARQLLYEEGDQTRGMNIYIDGGNLYCGFWNTNDDGDGAQSLISLSAPISASTANVVTWTFDYSNYTGASGKDGNLDCYFNGAFMGSANSTSRIFPHSGASALGAMNNGTYFHDGVDTGSKGHYFGGAITDLIINNEAMRSDTVQGLHNYLLP